MNNEFLFDVCSIQSDLEVDTVPNVAVNDRGIALNTRMPFGRIAANEIVVFARLDTDRLDAGRRIRICEIFRKNESFVFVGKVMDGASECRLELGACASVLICLRTHVVEDNSAICKPKRFGSALELKPDVLIPLPFVFNKRGR